MKRLIWAALLLLTCTLALPNAAFAKWWVFGKSNGEVSFRYIYINDIGFDEKAVNITLYKDALPDGLVKIRGKANAGKTAAGSAAAIGAVRVSTDGKETWNKARLADDGSFEYSFKAEAGKTYSLYIKAIDTSGKASDVDITHKEIAISDRDVKAIIREALDRMIEAYEQEDSRTFMQYVSQDFVGDPIVLERAVRKDFTFFDNIDMNYSISSIASAVKGKVYVSIHYNRFLVSVKDGKPYKDQGTTEFVFDLTDNSARVYSMKRPLIFGLSDAENVSSGVVNTGDNGSVINVGGDGTVVIGPPTGGPGAGDGSAAIPAPTNLRVTAGTKHSYIDLEFDCTLNFADAQTVYGVLIEESLSRTGPFYQVDDKPGYDTFNRVSTTEITNNSALLYYRVRIYRISDNVKSFYSNVVEWDNRLP